MLALHSWEPTGEHSVAGASTSEHDTPELVWLLTTAQTCRRLWNGTSPASLVFSGSSSPCALGNRISIRVSRHPCLAGFICPGIRGRGAMGAKPRWLIPWHWVWPVGLSFVCGSVGQLVRTVGPHLPDDASQLWWAHPIGKMQMGTAIVWFDLSAGSYVMSTVGSSACVF